MTADLDLLVVGAHPDDAEIGCGGLMLKCRAQDLSVAVLDMTEGEMGSRGSLAERRQECAAASKLLGLVERVNLRLPDAGVTDDEPALKALVRELRRLRPRILVAHHQQDRHPDHVATAKLATRAFFHAGLKNFQPDLGAAFRPELFLRYPANDHVEPGLCVDISRFIEDKRRLLECYASQVAVSDGRQNIGGVDYLTRMQTRDRYFGAQIGCVAAEPYILNGPVPVFDVLTLLTP